MDIFVEVSLCLSLLTASSQLMLTIPNCIRLLWHLFVCFELLLVTVYPPEPCLWVFHLVLHLFCGIGINTVGYGVAIMPRSMI
jgi:hypothetical protein